MPFHPNLARGGPDPTIGGAGHDKAAAHENVARVEESGGSANDVFLVHTDSLTWHTDKTQRLIRIFSHVEIVEVSTNPRGATRQ